MKLSGEERIKRCLEKHPDWTVERVANSLNLSIPLIRLYMANPPAAIANSNGNKPVIQRTPGIISLDKIREKFDVVALMLAELSRLPKGTLISEQELCQRVANTDRQRFRRTVENNVEQFKVLRIKLKLDEGEPKWFWGNVPDIQEAMKIRDL